MRLRASIFGRQTDTNFEVIKLSIREKYVQASNVCVSHILVNCLPPNCELQYPVRPLNEDEGFLSASIQGGSIYVDELIANFQLLAQGSLPTILNLWTKIQIG